MSKDAAKWRTAAEAFFAATPGALGNLNATIVCGTDGSPFTSTSQPAAMLPASWTFGEALRASLPLVSASNTSLLEKLLHSGGHLKGDDRALREKAINLVRRFQAVGCGASLNAYFPGARQPGPARPAAPAAAASSSAAGSSSCVGTDGRAGACSSADARGGAGACSGDDASSSACACSSSHVGGSAGGSGGSAAAVAHLPSWYDPVKFAELLDMAEMRPDAINDRLYRDFEATVFAFPGISFSQWKAVETMPFVGINAQFRDKTSPLWIHFKLLKSSSSRVHNRLAKAFAAQATCRGTRRSRSSPCSHPNGTAAAGASRTALAGRSSPCSHPNGTAAAGASRTVSAGGAAEASEPSKGGEAEEAGAGCIGVDGDGVEEVEEVEIEVEAGPAESSADEGDVSQKEPVEANELPGIEAEASAAAAAADSDLAVDAAWRRCPWPPLCGLTHRPLVEPARGPCCTHLAWFEAQRLKEYMAASPSHRHCPQHGCDATFTNHRSMQIDLELQQLIRKSQPYGARSGNAWLRRAPGGALEISFQQPKGTSHGQSAHRTKRQRDGMEVAHGEQSTAVKCASFKQEPAEN